MDDRSQLAQQALVAVCVTLALDHDSSPNQEMWADTLYELLPQCDDVPKGLAALRDKAIDFVGATSARRGMAQSALRFEARIYYQRAAGDRVQAFKDAGDRA